VPDRSSGDRVTELGIPGYTDAVEIGRGGFGVVYRARQPDFERTVAIKVLLTGRLDEQSRQRFDRERRIMGKLSDHPNIVSVFGFGFTSGGQPYLAMAYMAKGSLADRLDRDGPIGWQEVAQLGVKLSGALEAAHQAKVLHRDIKPENVLVSAYGEVTLADFGIARVEGGVETVGGVVTASVAHAAPEVLSGHRPTTASDVYGLGSTLLNLILGRPAFLREDDESILPMMARIGSDPVPDLRSRGVPDAICRALERTMAKDPDQRPASAARLGRELQHALDRAGRDNPRQTILAAPRVPSVPKGAHQPPPPEVAKRPGEHRETASRARQGPSQDRRVGPRPGGSARATSRLPSASPEPEGRSRMTSPEANRSEIADKGVERSPDPPKLASDSPQTSRSAVAIALAVLVLVIALIVVGALTL
jgi:serine/threonine protein kinase